MLIIEAALVGMIFFSEYVLMGTVLAISFFLICFAMEFVMLQFYVEVNESLIKVRTRRGKKYSFMCSDIDEVICSQRNSTKYGTVFYITIIMKSRELCMEGKMEGFQRMAEYILEKHESGEIKQEAVSKNCKTKLRQFKTRRMAR